jgi:hypothetical protein
MMHTNQGVTFEDLPLPEISVSLPTPQVLESPENQAVQTWRGRYREPIRRTQERNVLVTQLHVTADRDATRS